MGSSRKFSGSIEGALAAGGDPATSPLYVFGPFLALIVSAGVADVTFGPSIWLVVATVATVSIMYRLVMRWVTDGTGGSGLSEEEFGPWAAKINASITFIEYTLTFLVSMSALVTFLADRFPGLRGDLAGVDLRFLVAAALSVMTAALVNSGPRVAALTFGPATAGVLILLWTMMGATVWRFGFQLPGFDLQAFEVSFLGFTLGGYARILALMTGIEVFANLVAGFDGSDRRRSELAFRSLLIIMGSTAATMLVVGPAILALADPTNPDISVFTQTMDALLPAPLARVGTLIGVAVLISACATALQGIAHLSHGLTHRRYVPEFLGDVNRHGIASRMVWACLLVVLTSLFAFGTHEATYLALYAAGVFVLLSMTGWAATKRLWRTRGNEGHVAWLAQVAGVVLASALTSTATVIIFESRFGEGAWLYAVLIPVLYVAMGIVRSRRGVPSAPEDEIGRSIACTCPGLISKECACDHRRTRVPASA